jgi:hypothetical protein
MLPGTSTSDLVELAARVVRYLRQDADRGICALDQGGGTKGEAAALTVFVDRFG